MKQTIYLDYAAATPLDNAVLKAMTPFFSEKFYNPSANYLAAQDVKQTIESARGKIAHWLGSRPNEIIFTAGGTEANNLAIRGVLEAHEGSDVITSAIEHDSVLRPSELYKHHQAPVGEDGIVDVVALSKMISDKTVLVSVMYANNEIGTIQPIKEIAAEIEKIRRSRRENGNKLPLYLHTDAAQAPNYLDLHTARLGVDLMTLNGGKIYGPKQSGILYVKAGTIVHPQILGGGQEKGLRSGTENVAAIVGLAEALDAAQSKRKEQVEQMNSLQKLFIELLTKNIPNTIVNGSLRKRLPNNVHISLPGEDNERLLVQLEEAGILAAAGSACSASSDEPSHVLSAIGIPDKLAQSSLRFSMGRDTDESAVRKCVETLASLVA